MGTATTTTTTATPKPTADARAGDKRWKLLEATMRKHGYRPDALIESLHTAQESFGYLDNEVLRNVATSLRLPPSKVFGVATFYNLFTLKPQGKHTCVVCLGTACYIKGAARLLAALQERHNIKPGATTPNGQLSLLTARCFGSCAMAPVVVLDREVMGNQTPEAILQRTQLALAREAVHEH